MPKRDPVKEHQLAPMIAEGLTVGLPEKEAMEAHPARDVSGTETVRHMRDADQRLEQGARFASFVAETNNGVIRTGMRSRPRQADCDKTYTPAGLALLREGRQCLRCDEPQPDPFPRVCDVCGYPMRERQAMDVAMEFDGEKHLGPRKPISEYVQDLELRTEKRRFIDQVAGGGQGRIPKDWFKDDVLFPKQ